MIYRIFTSSNEQQAKPTSEYIVRGADSENSAIAKLYEEVKTGLQPVCSLGKYNTPDYTCGFQID